MIMNTMYSNNEDGLCGNDDAGQMSAWYVFSALGFYPVCPGSDQYAIGSPLVKSATIHFESGKKLEIVVEKQKAKNVYIKKILLNNKEIKNKYLLHSDLVNGGRIIFYMSSRHQK